MHRMFSTAVVAVGITLASSALFSNSAQAFSLSIAPQFGSTENTGSTAKLDFNFVQQGANVLLNLDVTNTTNGSAGLGATKSTLVGVAIDLLGGPVTSYSYNSLSSAFTKTFTNVSIPGPFSNVNFDFAFRSAGSGTTFVGGNPQAGLTAGQSTLVSFLLKGNGSLNATEVENSLLSRFSSGAMSVAGRFQQVNAGGGSDKVLGGYIPGDDKPEPPAESVPEPGTLLGVLAASAFVVGKKKLQRQAD